MRTAVAVLVVLFLAGFVMAHPDGEIGARSAEWTGVGSSTMQAPAGGEFAQGCYDTPNDQYDPATGEVAVYQVDVNVCQGNLVGVGPLLPHGEIYGSQDGQKIWTEDPNTPPTTPWVWDPELNGYRRGDFLIRFFENDEGKMEISVWELKVQVDGYVMRFWWEMVQQWVEN